MNENKNYLQIDLIKALAIVSVLIIHSIPNYYSRLPISIFTIEQAVPVFLLIMGLNGTMSFKRRSYIYLKQMYGLEYFKHRLKRFLIPFLIIFIMSLILGLIINYNYYVGTLSLIGYLPLSGPGNYFISIVLEFIFIFPIMYYIYKRNSMILLVLSFIISLLFELLAYQLHMNGETYIYNACVLRYLFVIALGICAADALKTTNLSFFKKNRKIWVLIVISIVYMFWVSVLVII